MNTEIESIKLMRIRTINMWIDRAEEFITQQRERFSSMGSPLANWELAQLPTAMQWLHEAGYRAWQSDLGAVNCRFPTGLETTAGALAAEVHVCGMLKAARAEWQRLMEKISAYQQQSYTDDISCTEAADSQQDTPASKSESSQAKP